MLLFNLSSFAIGFVYSKNPQKCGCYNDDNDDDNDDNNDDDNSSDNDDGDDDDDVMQCYGDIADIRQGYWFGNVSGTCTVSLCPIFYCDLSYHNIETVNGYYNFPRQTDDQCRPHRTGVACGDCSPGYTLAHNAPDCVDRKKCSGMLSLVIVLTILYWIIIVVGVCIMHSKFQISLGHLYGIIYFYSTVDVFLGNDLYTSDVVFQLVAVISSLAKLTPQFIGKLCSVEGLSGIDQQFINYIHVLAVSLILFAITKVVKYSRRMAYFGKHYIVRTICVLLLLAYTSLTSTSLQLLKPLTFNNVNDTFTFSSPDVKYFSGRHVVYGIVAILCVIIFVMGLPCLLLLEPFLQRKINLIKIKPLLDQFQGSYKDRYRWFAAYYFICRLAIFIISYTVGDYQSRLYFLQTTCVIIVVIHIWVQPYANELVNALDATILLNMVLVVNLNTYEFSDSTTKIICVFLVVTPICLLCAVLAQKPLTTWIRMKSKRHHDLDDATHLLVRYVLELHRWNVCIFN